MILDQVEALKVWLTNKLSPICDAEPIALAKYVCALLKKNKPEQDLKDICIDQLDVFLQLKTKPFVDELFEALHSKAYIPPESETNKPRPASVAASKNDKSPAQGGEKDKVDGPRKKSTEQISSSTDGKDTSSVVTTQASSTPSTVTAASGTKDTALFPHLAKDSTKEPSKDSRDAGPRSGSKEGRDKDRDRDVDSSRDRRDSWRDEKKQNDIRDARDIIRERGENRDKGDTREVREPRDREVRDRDRDRDFRRRRTRSRSFSPRRRDYDDRRRRYDERPRYSPDRRWGRRRSWSRSPRRNRSPLDRGPRARSRSPRLRSRSPRLDRYRSFRSRSRSRSPRPARSWSRPPSANRFRSRSPSNIRQPDSRGSTPTQDNDYSTLISSSTNDLPAVTSTVGLRPVGEDGRMVPVVDDARRPPPSVTVGGKARCQDFEEKGYCVLGDVCPYDHGSDPVVVEDVSIPGTLPVSTASGASAPPGGPGFVPPDLRVPPPGHLGMRINIRGAPPPHVEPYMPEAPGLQGPPRPPFLRGPVPDLRHPPPGMILNRPPPPDQFFPQRREVVLNNRLEPALEEDLLDTLASEKEPSRIVIPAKRPYSAIDNDPSSVHLGPPPPRMAHVNQHHHMFAGPPPPMVQKPPMLQQPLPVPLGPPPMKRGFDFNRLGNRGGFRPQGPRQPFKTGNLTLEVRKIPAEMNNIAKLNEHFGKFGTLTNIQVKYQGDTGAALISFSNNGEATAAYRSPEPVFNNRFIKLFWHNPERAAEFDMEKEVGGAGGAKEARDVLMQSTTRTGGRVGDGIDHPSLMLPVRPTIPPAHKLQLDNTKPKAEPASLTAAGDMATPTSAPAEKSIVYTSSVGNLKKTVFNPSAAVPSPTSPTAAAAKGPAPFISPTAVKTADYVSRMEAIKRAEEEKKVATVKQAELDQKRQELLAKQIQHQKVLLDALDKKKATMSETEKKSMLQTLRTISDAIDKVKYGTGTKKPATSAHQAPKPAQFKYVSQEQNRKEQLDRELDVLSKQKRGEDVSTFRAAPAPYGRGRGWAGGRGGWGVRGRGRGVGPVVGRTYLDNRPKTLEVKGFELHELEEVTAHFQKFGEIDKVDPKEEVPSAFFTFSTRQAAEMAVSQGAKFNQKTLVVRWNQVTPKIDRTESTQSSEVDEDLSITLGSLDDESLLGMSGDEKSRTGTPTLSIGSQQEAVPQDADLDTGLDSLAGDSRAVIEENAGTVAAEVGMGKEKSSTTVSYMRSMSDDLLLGDEHFKASYTDDEEDEEDHITVTLSNTTTPGTAMPLYAGGNTGGVGGREDERDVTELGGGEEGEDVFGAVGGEEEDEEDLANLEDTALDYTEDAGSWS
ncbi:RNA-binding protein 26 [Aplysia californica]|uniref:RNA-binding protein 26 n=1 Tax=Aplysia californica TaxID=6500 RepID=A0ABM0JTF6_APLCA|nr:RNA-binding protein 26 [Aplysia californica]